jgi:hypothetical protein
MIELVVIYFVGRQNCEIASAKGRSGVRWFAATACVWLGLQALIATIGILLLFSWYGLDSEFPELSEFLVVYASVITSKAAIDDHFKTGHMKSSETSC